MAQTVTVLTSAPLSDASRVYRRTDGVMPRPFRVKAAGTAARKLPGDSAGAELGARWSADRKRLLFNVAVPGREVASRLVTLVWKGTI